MSRTKTCEIHIEAAYAGGHLAPVCGRAAEWWSDDVVEGDTVYMCDRHCREAMTSGGLAYRRCSDCGEDVSNEDEDACPECARIRSCA